MRQAVDQTTNGTRTRKGSARRVPRAPISGAHVGAALGPTSPVLLILEPSMIGGPWPLATLKAATTLQLRGPIRGHDDNSVRASLEYATACARVEHVVLCRQGEGLPSELALEALRADAESLRARLPTTVQVDLVWYDTTAARLWVSADRAGALEELGARHGPSLQALFAPRGQTSRG